MLAVRSERGYHEAGNVASKWSEKIVFGLFINYILEKKKRKRNWRDSAETIIIPCQTLYSASESSRVIVTWRAS